MRPLTAIDLTDVIHPDNREMAVRAALAVGLDVAGIDFITPDIARSSLVRQGNIAPLILVDGAVVGTWAFDAALSQLRARPIVPWSPALSAAIDAHAEALAGFIARELDPPTLHLAVAAPGEVGLILDNTEANSLGIRVMFCRLPSPR